ncbi:MAG: dicarboxylate/amino acid:cation symporter [Parachlamydiaceae bacterium]|nr:dicarboxylate/amino acid:cation symporter [Parachlamydiaceae bacterium]
MKLNSSIAKIIIALLLACIAGYFVEPHTTLLGVPVLEVFSLIGELFLNALNLVVVPLVASSIILGAARLGGDEAMGNLGVKTFGYFLLTIIAAVLIGYAVVNTLEPGIGQSQNQLLVDTEAELAATTVLESKLETIENASQDGGFYKFKQLLLKILPSNILAAASQGQMLSLIVFCLLFGYFMAKIEKHASSVMTSFWKGLFEIMMKMTEFFMKALPIGIFALVAKVIATSGAEAFHSIAWFFVAVLIALAVHMGIVMPLFLKFIGRVSPLAHFMAISPALLTAFSTSSSAAALPVVIDCVEKRAGVSNRICGFTIPLGTAVNLSGSAMYACMVVFFIAQAYGVELPISTHLLIIIMSVLSSFGMAGVPSASLIAVVLILKAVHLPVEGVGLVLAVERILDMFRTATNVFGNTCCAVLVAKAEGESGVLSSNSYNAQLLSSNELS